MQQESSNEEWWAVGEELFSEGKFERAEVRGLFKVVPFHTCFRLFSVMSSEGIESDVLHCACSLVYRQSSVYCRLLALKSQWL
jgi:hypothetical protein